MHNTTFRNKEEFTYFDKATSCFFLILQFLVVVQLQKRKITSTILIVDTLSNEVY